MVGLRWVACWALLALSCGRTANPDRDSASGGSPSAVGGTGSGGASSGSGPVAMLAGAAGVAGAASFPECPVTPAEGQWFARGPDPYGFELTSDGVKLSGTGCLGALPWEGDALACRPLSLLADKGRSVDFVWDVSDAGFGAYVVKMELTLSPDRTAMAGTIWGSAGGLVNEKGTDIVLVRYPADQPLPAATRCSEGEPSGACFLEPLRSDYVDHTIVAELGSGDLLLVWLNMRGLGRQVASARFDAATGSWQKAELLDDGAAPIQPTSLKLASSKDGSATVVYVRENAVIARTYERDSSAWSEPKILAQSDEVSVNPRPVGLLAYEGGHATVLISGMGPEPGTLSAHDYDPAAGAWQAPQAIEDAATQSAYQWAAASDAAGNAIVVMVHGGSDREPHELWSSRRSPAGSWSAPTRFYTVDAQLLEPAMAIGEDGTAIVTWQEFSERLNSSVYSFDSGAWGEPLTITSQRNLTNRAVAFDDAGAPVAYFHCNDCVSSNAEQKSTFVNGAWGAPQTATAEDTPQDTYAVTRIAEDLEVARLKPRVGESPLPPLQRARCEGY